MRTEDLDYELPESLIATAPAEPRDAARLMVCDRRTGRVSHHHVRDLPTLGVLGAGDLMLVNQTRVLPARFGGTRRSSGGRVSGLYLRDAGAGVWEVMLESRGSLGVGEWIDLDASAALRLVASLGRGRWTAKLAGGGDVVSVLGRVGSPPLPPYIQRARRRLGLPEAERGDVERYNTVFAREPGSVAAPTAGLHLTPGLLGALEANGVVREAVTLHVGLGTFAPVRADRLAEHTMHAEAVVVPGRAIGAIRRARAAGRSILAVGTTTVRAIESLPDPLPDETAGEAGGGGFTARTELFIYPGSGFTYRFTDRLMTNFHLPRSTLLAMVAALPGVGLDRLMGWYRAAIDRGYRFYSYGDAMLIV